MAMLNNQMVIINHFSGLVPKEKCRLHQPRQPTTVPAFGGQRHLVNIGSVSLCKWGMTKKKHLMG